MDKYVIVTKRPRSSVDNDLDSGPSISSTNVQVQEQEQPISTSRSNVDFNPNDIVSDPGLRKQNEDFDVSIRDRVRREYISKGPCRPFGHNFPKTNKRNFRDEWFNMFDWLEYSISEDKAYCFACYLFKPTNVSRFGDDVFTIKGFCNWKKGVEKLSGHVGVGVYSVHFEATGLLDSFENQRQSVSHLLANQSRDMEVEYYVRLSATLDVVRILLRQGLSFRGHDESSTSLIKGNFLELLDWYTGRIKDICKVVGVNAPGNNHMSSLTIQKEMTNACAVETTLVILNDIGDKWFTILVDESRDSSVKEQMAVVLRYVNKHGEVIERVLAVVHVKETSSQCLKYAIDALFAKHGLSLSRLRGQGYDSASNMRGQFHG